MKTIEEYNELTNVSKEDLANAWTDERGVKYSADRKRLLRAPKELEGEYTVLSGTEVICHEAFNFVKRLIKVILPEGLNCIGYGAFGHCAELTDINIPSSVEFLGECIRGQRPSQTKIKSFTFPKSLEYITSVDGSIFYSIPKAEEYASESPKFPIINGCLIIDNTLVCYLGKDIHVVIPDGVTSIGVSAFFDCNNVVEISIPSSVIEIGASAFDNCTSLQGIKIPDSVKFIKETAFYNCKALKSIDIPASVTSIGDWAFRNCESLQTINIQGTPKIGKFAFKGCPGYNNPEKDRDRTKNVEGTASSYEHYRALAKVSLEEINNAWKDERGVKYSADKKRLIIAPQNIEGEYTVLPETEVICRMAFNEAVKLTKVVLPEGLQFIGEYSFHYCLGLKSIDIPQSVDYIDEGAFARCFDLETINILGAPRMGEGVFAWCKGNKKK